MGISCFYPANICWISVMRRRLNEFLCSECVIAYLSWMPGPTGCPGSVPDSETETQPWPNCCHTEKTGNRREQRSSSCRCIQAGLLRCHDHLVDSDSAAERTHASEVRRTASPVVKGDISVRTKEDVNRRRETRGREEQQMSQSDKQGCTMWEKDTAKKKRVDNFLFTKKPITPLWSLFAG